MNETCDICGQTPCATPGFCNPSRAADIAAGRKRPHLSSRCAANIEPERIEWLWPGRLARGKHTAIAGEPGDGKSQLSIFVAATISRGGEWPCREGRAPLGKVIFFNAEDGAADTVVPRLIAADADLERVHIVSAVQDKGRRSFNLQTDLALLEQKVEEIGDVALVIIDPVSSYMGKTDSHKNAEVRGTLEPLSEMAERLRVAILSITHFSKSGSGNSTKTLHRFIGSIAFTGAPRAAFAVIEDAENVGRILFLHAKNNIARKPQGLAYRILQREVRPGIIPSYVDWENEHVTVSADEALRASEDGGDRSAATRRRSSCGTSCRVCGCQPRKPRSMRGRLGSCRGPSGERVRSWGCSPDGNRKGETVGASGCGRCKVAKKPARWPKKIMAILHLAWPPCRARLPLSHPSQVLSARERSGLVSNAGGRWTAKSGRSG